jgi:hypothetical protein
MFESPSCRNNYLKIYFITLQNSHSNVFHSVVYLYNIQADLTLVVLNQPKMNVELSHKADNPLRSFLIHEFIYVATQI